MHQRHTTRRPQGQQPRHSLDRRSLLKQGAALGAGAAALGRRSGAAAQGQTELTLATDWTTDARGAIMEEAVAEFGRQFPQYRLVVEPIGGDYYDALSVQLAGGTAADVMLFSGAFFLNFAEQGAFADITPILDELGVDLSLYTQVPNVFQVGDQLYGMPFQLTITTWYANIDMFEAAGVPLPEDGWTWDEMLETAQALTIPEEEQFGVWMSNSAESQWGPFVLSAGGNWMNEDRTKTALADGDGFEGFKFAVELVTVHNVSPTPAQTVGLLAAGTDSPFVSGRTAMAPANSGLIGNLASVVGDRFRWQPIPQPAYPPTGDLRTTYNDQPHVINANAADLEGATQLAVFMAGDYVQGLIAEQRGSTPVLKSLQTDERYLSPPPPNMEQIGENLEFAEDLGFTRNWLEWYRAIESAADLAFIGEASPEDAFAAAIAAADEVLAQG
jgi:multiple sugar transport system substrate-binding protein